MIISVPLNKLELSEQNVRKTNRDEDIASLADDIASRGLKQNLVVTEAGKGRYKVDAGGRRFLALQLLAEEKRIPKNEPVDCLVEAPEHALETSLAENLHRVAMNPADELDAFAAVIARYAEDGMTDRVEQVANCARRFGVTYRRVEERLRLAALASVILEALREGRISLEAAKAYAAYPDQAMQLKVFKDEEKKGSWGHGDKAIRDAMRGKVYRLDHPAVLYVGIDAYRAAGGRIERELFMGSEDEDVILDPSIIERLCKKRAAEDATAFAQEEGWRDGVVKPWNGPAWQDAKPPKGFKRAYGELSKLTDEQKEESVLAFKIADDGSTLEPLSYFFAPEDPQAATTSQPHYETPEERAARIRADAIRVRASRLAVPRFAGTPFEGRAFWPTTHWVNPIVDVGEGFVLVAVQIKVPASDIDAAIGDAERLYEDELRAADEQAAAAIAAEGNGTDEEAPAAELEEAGA